MFGKLSLLGAVAALAIGAAANAQNDNCSGATNIGLGATPFSNVGATTEVTPACVLSGNDIWYAFTAPGIGNYQIDTCGSTFDTTLTIYNGCGGAILACNDDSATCGGSGLQSNVVVAAAAGQVLLIRVAGFNSAVGAGTLNVSVVGHPNETCAQAVPVGLGGTYWNNIGATTETTIPCVSSNSDVWYYFTAPNRGAYTFETCGSGFDTTVAIYAGCGGAVLACNDDSCGLQSSVTVNDIASGATVLIRLGGFINNQGTGVLTVRRTVPNDYCADATPVGTGTIAGSLNLATSDGSANCGASNGNPDVWYSFTAPTCGGTLMLDTCGSNTAFGTDTVVAVYDSCGGTQLSCNDDSPSGFRNCTPGSGNLDSSTAVNLNPGQNVRIRVSRFGSTTATDFNLHIGFDYVNEDCGNAVPISLGTTNWSNCLATTDGPIEANCGFCCGDAQVNNDVWYRLHVPVYGLITVDTFGSNFDTKLAAYSGNCPAGANTAIACNDDYNGLQSYMEFGANGNSDYLIRAGGYNQNRGSGPIHVHYYCFADFNRDGVVDFFDYLDFVQAFAANQASADFNHDGVIDFFDYLDFVGAFANGC